MFQRNSALAALFYGNDKGALVLLRPLRNNADRKNFNAPEKATMLLNYTKASGLNEFYYFDGSMNRVGYRKTQDNKFDLECVLGIPMLKLTVQSG